jgi:hypothetical protein
MIGDIIVGLNGEPTESHDKLMALLTGEVVGKATPVEVLRGGKPTTIQVTIGERKESPRRRGRRGWRYGPHVMHGGMRGKGFKRKRKKHKRRKGHPRGMVWIEKHLDDDDDEE